MAQPPSLLLLDASCLLNLYATGRLRDIALSLPYRLGVADYVLEQEALYIWLPGLSETREEQVPVDISSLVKEGIIEVLGLEYSEEEAAFVNLAALIDDGEAITGALAMHRGHGVATDDRKARRVLSEQTPSIPLVSTLDLVKSWAEKALVPQQEVQAALVSMRIGASYLPGERDPLYEWWKAAVSSKEG